jgi:poly-gamma-glutamate biosynthesis protein PgsC/CapC
MDPLTLSIGIGLVISLLFVGYLGLMTGGMVVPGYLALSMNHPGTIVLTLLDALVIFGIVRLLSGFLIVYGRRRIALIILIAFLLGVSFRSIFGSYFAITTFGETFTVIGYIIPGLIALSIDRQGLIETFCALLIAATLIRLCLILLIGPTVLTL